jgi:hypothetical protein
MRSVVRLRISRLDRRKRSVETTSEALRFPRKSLDSTVAESVAVDIRMIIVLPDRQLGSRALGPAGFG